MRHNQWGLLNPHMSQVPRNIHENRIFAHFKIIYIGGHKLLHSGHAKAFTSLSKTFLHTIQVLIYPTLKDKNI